MPTANNENNPISEEKDTDIICGCGAIHEDNVKLVRNGLTPTAGLARAAELFKVLGDPTRLKIINALILSEMCVCDIAAVMDMTQPAVSHHLKTLRQTKLVSCRRDGKIVYYSLDDGHVSNLFYQGLIHSGEEPAGSAAEKASAMEGER